MEIIYRVFDGKEFDNEADCCYHESELRDKVMMFTRNGARTDKTYEAFVVWLQDEEANRAFHEMARIQNDPDVGSIVEGEDYGFFVWDKCRVEYHLLDEEELSVIEIATKAIKERGEV